MFFLALFLASTVSGQVTRDSIVCKDSTYFELTTVQVCSTYQVPVTYTELRGMYGHPDAVTIGSNTSENNFLSYAKRKGCNMVNCYAKYFFETKDNRAKFAAFARKARDNYGFVLMTNDIRSYTHAAQWKLFYQEHPDLQGFVEPLTEKEPWVYNSSTGYDYTGTWKMLQYFHNLKVYFPKMKINFYEGWMGKYYSNPQAAVDSMVFYSDRIFISNYVSVAEFISTERGKGPWNAKIRTRAEYGGNGYGGITTSCVKFNKHVDIISIHSLEKEFLFYLYDLEDGRGHSYFGSRWTGEKSAYNNSPSEVLQYTDLVGKTIFHIVFSLEAQPY